MKKIIFFTLIVSLLLIVSCGPKQSEVVTTPEASVETPTAPVDTGMTGEAETSIIPEGPMADTSTELLTELRCVGDKINGIVKNPLDYSITLGKEVKVMINGLIVIDPECDSMTIEPGMSTLCQDLSGHYPIRAGKINTVKLNYAHTSVIEEVQCP